MQIGSLNCRPVGGMSSLFCLREISLNFTKRKVAIMANSRKWSALRSQRKGAPRPAGAHYKWPA